MFIYIGGGMGTLLVTLLCMLVWKLLKKETDKEVAEAIELEQADAMESVEGLSREELERILSSKK